MGGRNSSSSFLPPTTRLFSSLHRQLLLHIQAAIQWLFSSPDFQFWLPSIHYLLFGNVGTLFLPSRELSGKDCYQNPVLTFVPRVPAAVPEFQPLPLVVLEFRAHVTAAREFEEVGVAVPTKHHAIRRH